MMVNIMRRPVAFLFASFAGGICVDYFLGFWAAASVLALIACVFLLIRLQTVSLFLIIALLGTLYFDMTDSRINPLHIYENEVVSVKGRIESIQKKEYCYQLVIRAESWDGKNDGGRLWGKIIINMKGEFNNIDTSGIPPDTIKNHQSLTGRDIEIKGRVLIPKGRRNPGLLDYKLYLKTKRIYTILDAYSSYLTVKCGGNPLTRILAEVKYSFSCKLDRILDNNTKGLLLGMLFGDKTMLDENIYEAFQRNGTAHILAVSGIHVGIIYIFIEKLFHRRRGIKSSVTCIGLLLLYALLSSFSPSVVRAVIMIVIHIISKHLHKRYDLLCCASFSAFVMLLSNPHSLFNFGFQLSYLAVFTLAFLLPLINCKIQALTQYRHYKTLSPVLTLMAPVFAIQVGMIPATAFLFQYFSVSAFFLNLPVIALAGIIIPLGILLMFLSFLGGAVFGIAASAVYLLLQLMVKLNIIINELIFYSFTVASPSAGLVFLYYGILFFCSSEFFWICLRKQYIRRIIIICIIIAGLSLCVPFVTDEYAEKADIVFVDVGQGDCIHIRTPSGKNILIDGGGKAGYDVGKEILLPYLLKNGTKKLDLALVTHLHDDHYLGIASLCNYLKIEKLGLYEANIHRREKIINETGLNSGDIVYLTKGDRITIEKDIWIDILYPEKHNEKEYEQLIEDEQNENSCSLLMQLNYKGFKVLITGDIGFAGEEELLEFYNGKSCEILRSDILKAGHHGSRFSTGEDFLEAVKPEMAIIQVGQNNFGHPHPDVIEKLEKKDIMIYRNDLQGAVLVDVGSKFVSIRTML